MADVLPLVLTCSALAVCEARNAAVGLDEALGVAALVGRGGADDVGADADANDGANDGDGAVRMIVAFFFGNAAAVVKVFGPAGVPLRGVTAN